MVHLVGGAQVLELFRKDGFPTTANPDLNRSQNIFNTIVLPILAQVYTHKTQSLGIPYRGAPEILCRVYRFLYYQPEGHLIGYC